MRCTDRSTPEKFYGICNDNTTSRLGLCCSQEDIQFLDNIGSIYTSRTIDITDPKLEQIDEYFQKYHEYDRKLIDLKDSTKKGKYLIKMLHKYKPESDKNVGGFFVYNMEQEEAISKDIAIIYIKHNGPGLEVPLRRFLTIMGQYSTFDYDSIMIFNTPSTSTDYEKVLDFFNMRSNITIDMPMNTSDISYMITGMVETFVEVGEHLSRRYLQNKKGQTHFEFSFQNQYITKESILLELQELVNVIETSHGISIHHEKNKHEIDIEIYINNFINVKFSINRILDIVLEKVIIGKSIMDETVFDVVMQEDKLISDHLQDDDKNIVIIHNDHKTLLNIDDILTTLNENIVYECITADGKLFPTPENIVSTIDLLLARRIGLPFGLLLSNDIKQMLRESQLHGSTRIYKLSIPGRLVQSVVGQKLFHDPEESRVSANHCQPDGSENLFNILKVRFD